MAGRGMLWIPYLIAWMEIRIGKAAARRMRPIRKRLAALAAPALAMVRPYLREAIMTAKTLAAALSLVYHAWRLTRAWKAHRKHLNRVAGEAQKVQEGRILGRPVEIKTGKEE